MCGVNKTPFLNDMYLLDLNVRSWTRVDYTECSERLDFMGNHCTTVLSDGDAFERIIVFGGIRNVPGD